MYRVMGVILNLIYDNKVPWVFKAVISMYDMWIQPGIFACQRVIERSPGHFE